MEKSSIPYKVHQCSRCTGDTEYYCLSCPSDMCPQCKENHVKDLQTIDHIVETHRDEINFVPTEEFCVRHTSKVLRKYCEPCELPVCYHCRKHRNHRQIDVTTAFDIKRKQHRETFYTIRSEAFFYRPVIMTQIKADVKTCHTEFSLYQSDMLTKAQKLKYFIDDVLYDLLSNVFCDFNFKHRCLKQEIEMRRHIVSLQIFAFTYEQSAFTFSALQFLSSIKTCIPQKYLKLHTSHLSMTEPLNKDDVMESLSGIQIKERGKRRVEYQNLLKLTPGARFHQCFKQKYESNSFHISCVISYRVWVSHTFGFLTLIDTTLDCMDSYLEFLNDDLDFCGSHTLSSERNLIFIDRNSNISKMSKDMKKTSILIWRTDSTWETLCVYCSQSTGDLLVGTIADTTKGDKKGKISRYNKNGQLTQTIPNDNTKLYRFPAYVTENNNGDVVVSDYSAVVVTERGGRHRFSYTGPPSGSGLQPCGICTDALSHILVCDVATKTVQMIDRDGQFLSHLLIRPSGIFTPCSLGYDVITHRLWVGSSNNLKVVVYRYITIKDTLTDLKTVTFGATAGVMESLSEIPTKKTEETKQGNKCLLKLISPPELLHSYTVTDVYCCFHISLTSGRVWVSNECYIILTDTTGVPLHRVNDLPKLDNKWSTEEYGLHTVNSGNELIYIDIQKNVKKLSKDMKRSTIFIKRTAWAARCVYCSPSTGNLLVGMCIYNITDVAIKSKLTRYNQSGQLTQTIKYDNTGLELYNEPNYVTENNNGDVVVSDSDAIVVTYHGGRHRFSYTGHPSGSGLEPRGICTDALSHILVCDERTKTVQMLDMDGQFLSHLLIRPSGKFSPCSLCYDVNTHCLWVGSGSDNRVHVYQFIDRQDALTDEQACTAMIGRTCPAQHQPEDEDRLDIDRQAVSSISKV